MISLTEYFLTILVSCVFYLEYPYKKYPSAWCGSNWQSDWNNRVFDTTVDKCKDICSATTGCSMITHADQYNGVEFHICVLCTPGYGIAPIHDQYTAYVKTGKISTMFLFKTVFAFVKVLTMN